MILNKNIFAPRVSLPDKIVFTRNLSLMIKAGLSLAPSLEALAEQTGNKSFQKIILEVASEVKKGNALSDKLNDYPSVFDDLFVYMVKAGEAGGNLSDTLLLIANQLKKDYEFKSKLLGAMVYPAFILIVMVLIGIFMMIFVVPKLTKVLIDMKVALPVTTQIIISISSFMEKYPWLIFGLLILIIVGGHRILKIPSIKEKKDELLLQLPITKKIIREINIARFARVLSSLLSSGVPIVNSIDIASKTLSSIPYQKALEQAMVNIQRGERLSKNLIEYKNLFPSLVTAMITVGEETGQTVDILKTLADFYEESVENFTKNFSTIIEPALMILIGGAVGFFILAMIQPMFSVYSNF